MKRIVVSIQNGLLAEAITRILGDSGEFVPYRIQTNSTSSILKDCEAFSADILLMEVSYAEGATMDKRIDEGKIIKKELPYCKVALLCDENAAPDIAHEVVKAKKDGIIDTFFYSSVTGSYLTAALDTL